MYIKGPWCPHQPWDCRIRFGDGACLGFGAKVQDSWMVAHVLHVAELTPRMVAQAGIG